MSFTKIKEVRGMKDIFHNYQLYDKVVTRCKQFFDIYGYKRILSNSIEREEVFTRTLGLSSDIVQKEMYRFQDLSGNNLVLRPEGTAGVMRFIVSDEEILRTIEKQPSKLWYWGPMYRYERPQAGRMRQFYQVGIERVGGASKDIGATVEGDFESIHLAIKCLENVFKDTQNKTNFKLILNNLGNKETLSKYNNRLLEYYQSQKHLLSDHSKKRVEQGNALRIFDSKDIQDQQVSLQAPSISEYRDQFNNDVMIELKKLLQEFEINYEIDDKLVRGLDYYNGTCFEIKFQQEEQQALLGQSQNTILAGGRYDHLASQFGYQKSEMLPAIGWGAGIDRLVIVLSSLEKQVQESYTKNIIGITYLVENNELHLAHEMRSKCLKIADKLRSKESIKVEVDLREKAKLKDKLQILMNEKQSSKVILLGASELQNQKVTIKEDQKQSITIDESMLDEYLKLN